MSNKKGFFGDVWDGFRSLPIAAQVLITALLALIVWRVISAIMANIETRKLDAQISKEQNTLIASGEKLSYPVSNYKTFADQLYGAMNGFGSTHTYTVAEVMNKMNNNLDVLELNKAYGKRDLKWLGFSYSYDLSGALRSELGTDIEGINKILSNKGIVYQY